VNWQYVSPDEIRSLLAWHELEVASLKLALRSLETGHMLLLGDGPYGPRYTAPQPVADPLAGEDIQTDET